MVMFVASIRCCGCTLSGDCTRRGGCIRGSRYTRDNGCTRSGGVYSLRGVLVVADEHLSMIFESMLRVRVKMLISTSS